MGQLIVIDVNVLHRQSAPFFERALAAYREAGDQLALPDAAMREMTNDSERWQGMLSDGLRHIAPQPESIVLMHLSWEVRRRELDGGALMPSFVDQARTVGFRGLLRDVQNGAGPVLANVTTQVPRLWPWAAREEIKKASVAAVRAIRDEVRAIDLKASQQPDVAARVKAIRLDMQRKHYASLRDFMRDELGREPHQQGLFRTLVSTEGRPPREAAVLAKRLWGSPSVCALYTLALGALGLRRYFLGEINDKVANSVVDLEYVVAGLCAGCLVTNDKGARDLFDDVKVVGPAIWPDFDAWFEVPKVWSAAEWRPLAM